MTRRRGGAASGGKCALNEAVAVATGEVLVFTDADVSLDPGALAHLIGNFADPEVGGATGRKAHIKGSGAGAIGVGEGVYTRIDEWEKQLESRIASTVSSHGALHALRRELYVPISDVSQADDMAISMRVVLQGKRLIYESEAVARVDLPLESRIEFARKVRVANQVMRALMGLCQRLAAGWVMRLATPNRATAPSLAPMHWSSLPIGMSTDIRHSNVCATH